MYSDLDSIKSELELKRERACSDNICRQKVRNKDHHGGNQQSKERMICKIGLC